jgi:HEAT repeat protein
MNRKWIYAFVAALIVIVVVVVLWKSDPSSSRPIASSQDQSASQNKGKVPVAGGDPGTSAPSATASKPIDTEHKENVRKGLEAIVEGLKQMGATDVLPVADQLKAAVESGDPGTMLRAFNEAIYGRFAQMSEAILAIKPYLNFPEPYVRYLAAETLTRVGDKSGVEGLIKFVSDNDPILNNGNDLRIEAARMLGKYGDERAASGLINLYDATKNGSVLNALARIQANNPSAKLLAEISGRQSPGFVVFNLGLAGLPQGQTLAREALKDPKVPSNEVNETKMIAAWALTKNLNDEAAQMYLIESARPAIERQEKGSLSYDDSTKALKYLGSVQSPQAAKVLEQALDSQNPIAVQYATVNLLFNQPGGSEKAEQLVLKELQASPKKLGIDLTMQIASKLDNPEINAAAKAYDLRTGGDRWRYWGVERAEWPIQNWIYDYVVTVNP